VNKKKAKPEDRIFRRLQQHLDRQAVGFPSTRSGADILLLKKLFSPDEAKLALQLSYKPATTKQITERAAPEFSPAQAESLLESMFTKGAIGWKEQDGIIRWYLLPMVVGMYEGQDVARDPRFFAIAGAYMKTLNYGKSFLAVNPSQMRTIPINKSVGTEHHVATYDQLRAIVEAARGPFVVLKCICRESMSLRRKPCAKTSRRETCMAFDDIAAAVLRRKHGREITRDEALTILRQNEDDGLVLQPANTQQPGFVCSCCGCCCGMLSVHKKLPHPVDFWTSNFQAEVSVGACSGCGKCERRCQVDAVTMTGPGGTAKINLSRCIGCGLCVSTCPGGALRLRRKERETIPPKNEDELYETIMANKKGALGQLGMLLKVALKMRQ
jgi:Na+-translocating ferredoxin:NAD+ oxidoreductase subunit B